jgi:hypothetical protein
VPLGKGKIDEMKRWKNSLSNEKQSNYERWIWIENYTTHWYNQGGCFANSEFLLRHLNLYLTKVK